jgi:hypothetical protein
MHTSIQSERGFDSLLSRDSFALIAVTLTQPLSERAIMGYIANPNDSSTIVCTSTDNYTVVNSDYKAVSEARENARREREMRNLGFGQRHSHCG